MSKGTEELKAKVEEVIACINKVSRETELANLEVKKVQDKKEGLERECVSLQKNIVELKDVTSDIKIKQKADKDAVDFLLTVNKTKQAELDTKLGELAKDRAKVGADLVSVKNKQEDANFKYNRANNIEAESEERLKRSEELLRAAQEKEIKISNELATIAVTEAKANERFDLARVKLEEANAVLKSAEDKALANAKLEQEYADNVKILDKKREELRQRSESVSAQEEAITYKELEINKIIKDKDLGKDIADKKELDKKKSELAVREENLENMKKDLDKQKLAIESDKSSFTGNLKKLYDAKKEIELAQKKLNDDSVKIELEKFENKKRAEDVKKREDILTNKEMRLLKLAREKGIKIELDSVVKK